MSYLGVDLHTNSFTVCRRTKQNKKSVRTFSIARIADFRKTLRKRELLTLWRNRLIEHLSERGDEYVNNGKLVVWEPKDKLYSPFYENKIDPR